jgi:4-hydroxyproline epimerase
MIDSEQACERIRYIDSHTEGEPTRVILDGVPDLGNGTVAEQLERLRQQDWFRRSVILEPRGWDAMVGAVLCEPKDTSCAAGVVFINNAGYLGMCGHGAIGVAVTLHHLGRIPLGRHWLETPVGKVQVDLLSPNRVSIENVPSYRLRRQVEIIVDGLGKVAGDVAWGGNWFFLVEEAPAELTIGNLAPLTDAASKIRAALREQAVTGTNGAEIDHVEFFGRALTNADSRNYVYCPGGAYDRSPCGTGTSAKVACLAADGKLKPGEVWVQESIIGSRFEASYQLGDGDHVIPQITGLAFVCAEGFLVRQLTDPLRDGISAAESNPYESQRSVGTGT